MCDSNLELEKLPGLNLVMTFSGHLFVDFLEVSNYNRKYTSYLSVSCNKEIFAYQLIYSANLHIIKIATLFGITKGIAFDFC